jgi:hypothetical protein
MKKYAFVSPQTTNWETAIGQAMFRRERRENGLD